MAWKGEGGGGGGGGGDNICNIICITMLSSEVSYRCMFKVN